MDALSVVVNNEINEKIIKLEKEKKILDKVNKNIDTIRKHCQDITWLCRRPWKYEDFIESNAGGKDIYNRCVKPLLEEKKIFLDNVLSDSSTYEYNLGIIWGIELGLGIRKQLLELYNSRVIKFTEEMIDDEQYYDCFNSQDDLDTAIDGTFQYILKGEIPDDYYFPDAFIDGGFLKPRPINTDSDTEIDSDAE